MEINELELDEEMIKVESSPESNSSSGSSKKDSVATSTDHDPGATFVSACSSSFIASEDLYQDEAQSGTVESSQSKLEDDIALGTSAIATPTKQAMDKDEDKKPYRIPSSVFNISDSSAPAEWSGTSNDSLFSLHGAISASKDQSLLLREESDKSRTEEATKIEGFPSNSPPEEKEVETKELVIDKTKENDAKAHFPEEELAKHSSSVRVSSVSCRSDASDGSTFSFAFPILASGRTQTSSIKEGGSSPNTTHSIEPHSQPQPDNDLNTPPPPQPQSASRKGFFSCFSNCCFPCSSCWPFKS